MGTEVATKWVYEFSEGSRDMRDLLGGKGANVAEMTRVLGPELVPLGFTITTEACVRHLRDGGSPDGLEEAVDAALARLEARTGRRLGDAGDPLLVSVRSGARDSMPGASMQTTAGATSTSSRSARSRDAPARNGCCLRSTSCAGN